MTQDDGSPGGMTWPPDDDDGRAIRRERPTTGTGGPWPSSTAGNPDAAAVLLARLREVDPTSTAVLETHARALFDSRRYQEAADAFAELVERSPAEDYAHYGLGMSLWRLQRFPLARDHLAMAAVMRPQRAEYARALAQVRSTLKARAEAGLPLEGPVSP